MPQLTGPELAVFLPHAGAMRLIDSVEWWDDSTIHCRTRSHHSPQNPLRNGARLEAIAGLEYAAQAMGIHVGLRGHNHSSSSMIGYIGAVRDVRLTIDRLDDCASALMIDATRLHEDDRRFMYHFAILATGQTVMTGRASLFLNPKP